MKTTIPILLAIGLLAPAMRAQGPDDQAKGWKHNHNHEAMLANLPADEREKVKAAHEKAMQDPAVLAAHEKMKQARKDFHDAMHAAMLKADPTIESILAKLPKPDHEERPGD